MLQEAWDYLTTGASWTGRDGLITLTSAHVRLSLAAVLAAAAVAIPPALWLGHRRRGGAAVVTVVNISRAIPTFAVIALVLPLSLQWGFGLGFWPTFVALFLLALPPIFVNSYLGITEVDAGTVESARAMGMRDLQVLRSVELPAALPLVATGLRISAVQVVATTTLGALVGYRCLGTPILQALATRNDGKLVAGALLVALLSLATEAIFAAAARRLTPWTRPDADAARFRTTVREFPDPEPAT